MKVENMSQLCLEWRVKEKPEMEGQGKTRNLLLPTGSAATRGCQMTKSAGKPPPSTSPWTSAKWFRPPKAGNRKGQERATSPLVPTSNCPGIKKAKTKKPRWYPQALSPRPFQNLEGRKRQKAPLREPCSNMISHIQVGWQCLGSPLGPGCF